jgi:hypothetical protein
MDSRSLAEHIPNEVLRSYVTLDWHGHEEPAMIPVSIDESLIEIFQALPVDWRQLPAPLSTREVGTRWVAESRLAVIAAAA